MQSSPRRTNSWATRALVLLTAILVGLFGPSLVPPAAAQTSEASQVLSLVNSTRAAAGLGPVAVDGALSAVAQSWAGVMAGAGTISHNPNLGGQISGWSNLAENVGMGSSIDAVHQLLVNSAAHYANMTGNYTMAGAGVVNAGGQVFVVQVFMLGQSAPPPPPPPPPPAPEPEPVAWEPEPVAWEPEPVAPTAEPEAPAPSSSYLAPGPAAVTPPEILAEVPRLPVEPSPWLAQVVERLQALDRSVEWDR
jgi:uncharacterized protein YkwD